MILLDTHAWLWWLGDSESLSHAASSAIDEAIRGSGVAVSTISTWEIALLIARGRLKIRIPVGEWVATSEAIENLSFVSPSNSIMLESVALPGDFHSDPADRVIVATARVGGMPVVTKDTKLRDYPHVEAIW